MINRYIIVALLLVVFTCVAIASDNYYLIVVDNKTGDITSELVGFPGRAWGKTADKIYLAGGDEQIAWLNSNQIGYKTIAYNDEPSVLYLCYYDAQKTTIDLSGALDFGDGYALAKSPIAGAGFCRRLSLRQLPFVSAELPSRMAVTYDARIDTLIGNVRQDTLLYYLNRLSGHDAAYINGQLDTIRTRYSGTADIRVAANYIKQILEGYGYQTQFHGYYGGTLRHVAAYGSQRAWTVSEGGEGLRTTDGGTNWTNMPLNISSAVWGVSNIGQDSVWVTGDAGTIRFSSNGGNSFVTQNAGNSIFFFGSSFVSPTRGWIAADSGLVYKTINAGTNWVRQATVTGNRFYDVCFVDSSYGWAVGRSGVIVRTTNGGTSWSQQTSNTTQRLYGVDFIDRNNGWAVGWGGVVRHTTNGGTNWLTVNLGTTIEKYHVEFSDSQHGCIVGWGGETFITTDGGTNWAEMNSGTTKDFYGVTFTDNLTGYAVGNGIIAKTTDGGNNWINQVGGIASAWVNVIATKTGLVNPAQQVVVCGHYDNTSESPQTSAPGADDNGSGTIGVLETARIFADVPFEKTIKFCLWSGEEQGLLGSEAYAAEAYSRGDNIVGVFNFDMISWDGNSDASAELHCGTGASSISLGQLFQGVVTDYSLGMSPDIITSGATGASDHASFWDYGYPAMLGIEDYSSDFNPYYHTTSDNMTHIIPAYFTKFAKAAVGSTATLAIPTIAAGDSTGAIAGRVIDRLSAPISNAIITVFEYPVSDTTGPTGNYILPGLNHSSYTIHAVHPDYWDTTLTNIVVTARDTTTLDISMNFRCIYTLGDYNSDSSVMGSDITYAVRYFKGIGGPLTDSCYHDSLPGSHYLFVSGDVNASCTFLGSDVTRLVAYFKGQSELANCRFFPPTLAPIKAIPRK